MPLFFSPEDRARRIEGVGRPFGRTLWHQVRFLRGWILLMQRAKREKKSRHRLLDVFFSSLSTILFFSTSIEKKKKKKNTHLMRAFDATQERSLSVLTPIRLSRACSFAPVQFNCLNYGHRSSQSVGEEEGDDEEEETAMLFFFPSLFVVFSLLPVAVFLLLRPRRTP